MGNDYCVKDNYDEDERKLSLEGSMTPTSRDTDDSYANDEGNKQNDGSSSSSSSSSSKVKIGVNLEMDDIGRHDGSSSGSSSSSRCHQVFQCRLQLKASLGGRGRSNLQFTSPCKNTRNMNDNCSSSSYLDSDVGIGAPLVAAGSEDGSILLCSNKGSRKSACSLVGHNDSVNQVHWSPSIAGLLVSASDDGTLRLWHLPSEQQ